MANTWVVVPEIRHCDMCDQDPPVPAYADGKTTFGPWADMCKPCFEIHGVGLGLGMGQELLLEPPETPILTSELNPLVDGVPHDVTVSLWEGLPVILENEGA